MNPCGGHLSSCETHTCDETYFKCPGFYCIPLRYVCDGRHHCPGGMEERQCDRRSCPGKFRCYQKADGNTKAIICIHPSSIWDERLDCPYGDDEYFRDYSFPACTINCTCLLFSVVCNGANSLAWEDDEEKRKTFRWKNYVWNEADFFKLFKYLYSIFKTVPMKNKKHTYPGSSLRTLTKIWWRCSHLYLSLMSRLHLHQCHWVLDI